MVWRNAAKVVAAAAEAVGRAFTRAVREELRASSQAAQRQAEKTGQSQAEAKQSSNANAKLGISLQEAIQILNAKEPLELEDVQKKYEHLFKINDRKTGGSIYLQGKVFRAKERIDEEFRRNGIEVETKEPVSEAKQADSGQKQ